MKMEPLFSFSQQMPIYNENVTSMKIPKANGLINTKTITANGTKITCQMQAEEYINVT